MGRKIVCIVPLYKVRGINQLCVIVFVYGGLLMVHVSSSDKALVVIILLLWRGGDV